MKSWPLLLFLLSVLSACNSRTAENQKNIVGTWERVGVKAKSTSKGIIILPPFDASMSGMGFNRNGTFESKDGSFLSRKSNSFIWFSSNYKITSTDISFLDLKSKSWQSYPIKKLTPDLLILDYGDRSIYYKKFKAPEKPLLLFDTVILSRSGCYGACPILSLLVSRKGDVKFNGVDHTVKTGYYSSSVDPKIFAQIQHQFLLVNLNKLKDSYSFGADLETITVSFVKNGRICKSVSDNGYESPPPFRWAYLLLTLLPDKLSLTPANYPNYLKRYTNYQYSSFVKDQHAFDLLRSEHFLLMQYLGTGKTTSRSFKYSYQLSFGKGEPKIPTDGRFYRLQDPSSKRYVTIDIGFNFITTNIHREWRELTEYD
ncbi:hypothetical protein C8P68_10398 [Mucilaginibacter yixingensis]|uniref:DUF6438 domain-containing protein n=2 Tax=Mucilaginibacter yixingensis TaxID=1295612 RepID=A0A2T5JAY3_9SPHI|nr:hypothetical protein C8P68_10398 [Mucilaginibacter yixingensis]